MRTYNDFETKLNALSVVTEKQSATIEDLRTKLQKSELNWGGCGSCRDYLLNYVKSGASAAGGIITFALHCTPVQTVVSF